MILEKLSLLRFRNFSRGTWTFAPGLNLLAGPNGAGKTNLLEAVSLLTGWGSFPERRVRDIPSWEQENPALAEGYFTGEAPLAAEARINKQSVLRRGAKRCTAGELREAVPALFFLPSDMALVEGGASVRRRFLNRLCALLHPGYVQKLHDYRRLLRHKNALLRRRESTKGVDRLLTPRGIWLWRVRERALELFLDQGMPGAASLLAQPVTLTLRRGGGGERQDPREDFPCSLALRAREERIRGRVLVGPQGDDLFLEAAGREARVALSRGQRRRLVVALMLAMGHVVESVARKKPLFVMDEVTAELDCLGRKLLFQALEATEWQVLAATAEPWREDWPGTVLEIGAGEESIAPST